MTYRALARVAALVVTAGGCTAPLQGVGTTPGAPAPAPGSPALVVSDEVSRIGTDSGAPLDLVVLDNGTIVVGYGPDGSEAPSTIVAYAGPWQELWRATVPGSIAMVSAGPSGGVLAGSRNEHGVEITMFGARGERVASTTLNQLMGEPCEPTGQRWLASENMGVRLVVACGTPRQAVHLLVSHDLKRRVQQVPWLGGDADDPAWAIKHERQRTLLVHDGTWTPLAAPERQLIGGLSLLTKLGPHDGVVAANVTTAGEHGYRTHVFVRRVGPSHTWTNDLIAEQDGELVRLLDVSVAGGRITVAFAYSGPLTIAGMTLPALAGSTPFSEHGHRLAVAELDASTGRVVRVELLRGGLPLGKHDDVRVRITGTRTFVLHGRRALAFARDGVSPVAPVAPPASAPLEAREPPALTATQIRSITERWSTVCGPRKASKKNAPCRIEHVAIGKDGSIVAAGGYYQTNQLGTQPLPRRAYETGVIAVFSPDGALRWHKTFGRSWNNPVTDVRVLDDGRVVALGRHGLGFSIDGVAIPERNIRVVEGQDMAWEASTPYLAIFDARGKLEVLEDIDMLALGVRSGSRLRACSPVLEPGSTGEALWLVASCTLTEAADRAPHVEHATVRMRVRGGAVEPATRILDVLAVRDAWPWTIDANGRAHGVWHGHDRAAFLQLDGSRTRSLTLVADGKRLVARQHAADTRRVWATLELEPRDYGRDRSLAIASADAGLSSAVLVTLVNASHESGANIDGITLDEHGRAIVSIYFEKTITIAGQTIEPPATPAGAPTRGRVFVRLTSDGNAIDRVLVAHRKRGGCTHPGIGALSSLVARGGRLAITLSFGVDPKCGVKDEPSSVMVFDL